MLNGNKLRVIDYLKKKKKKKKSDGIMIQS